MADTPWSATAVEAWGQWLKALQGLSDHSTTAGQLRKAREQARNAVEACPGAGSELCTFLETTERNSSGLTALAAATFRALLPCYEPNGPQSESSLSFLRWAGLQGLQLLQEHIKWMAAAGSTWPEDTCDGLANFALRVLPGWFSLAAKSGTPLHPLLHSEGMRLARQVVTAFPDRYLPRGRLVQGVSSWQEVTQTLTNQPWQEVTQTLTDRPSADRPWGLPASPVPVLIQFAHGVLFLPSGEQRWKAKVTRRIAEVPLLLAFCRFLNDIEEYTVEDALTIKAQALQVLSCSAVLPTLHEVADEYPRGAEVFASAHMAASRMLTEVVRLLRDRLATCQAGTGNSLGAAASAAAVESPAGGPERPEDFSGCSSAPAVQRRERGPRRHVQQAGQGQQPPSLGLLEQFCQDYQSYSRFMATFVPMVIKGAGLDLYREHRAALHQALLLGCRACVAALHMLSHQPSVPCSSCSDRPSAPTPRDVSRLEQRCSDAYLTQLAALGQFKESDVPLLKQEVAAAAMASSTSTASVVSDGQIAADHRLPGPLSALCFVLASRLSPHYSSLLKSSYQRLCLSPFTWQQEVAPRGVVCEWALTLLIAGLEALKPGELASLNTEERHSLSMSLLRCLDTLGKVARQERQIAGQQEMQLGRSTTQAASSWLLAGFSGLLESLCVALASLQEVTDSAASAAAPAAALSVGEPTASVEPSAFRSPGAEVVTKASIFLAASAAMHLSRALENPAAGGGWDRSLPSPALCHWRWVVNLVALGRETSAGLAAAAARLLLSNISLREDDRVAADAAAKDRLVSLLSCECGAQPLAVVSLAASTILIVLAGSLFLELDHQSKAAAPQDGSSVQRRQKLLRSVIKTCCQTVDEAADTSFASQEQMIDQNAKWMMQWNLDERIGDVRRAALGAALYAWQARLVGLLPLMRYVVAKAQAQTSGQPASSGRGMADSAEVPLVALQRDVAVSAVGCCAATRCSSSEVVWAWQRPAYLCARCRVVRYCRAECARLDWPRHRPICQALAALRRERSGTCA